nr:tetratricopeptide repeat protein [Desulfobacterales bacterium]
MKHYFSFKHILILLFFFFPVVSSLSVSAQESGKSLFDRGRFEYDDGNYRDAITFLEKAIKLEPDQLEYQYYLGLAYKALDREGEALKIFESIVKKDPVHFQKANFEIAAIYSKKRRFREALSILKQVTKVEPKNANAFLNIGLIYLKLDRFTEAIDNLERSESLDPRMAQVANYHIALVYYKRGEYDRAIDVLNKLIKAKPRTAMAQNARQLLQIIKEARRTWYLNASLGFAYDDNVLLNPLDPPAGVTPAEKDDFFQSIMLSFGYKFINISYLEAGLGYTLYHSGYRELIESNVLGHIPNIWIQYNSEPIYLRIRYEFSYYYAGGCEADKKSLNRKGLYLSFGSGSEDKLLMHSIMPVIVITEPYNMRSEITLNWQKKDYRDGVTPDSVYYSAGIVQFIRFPKDVTRSKLDLSEGQLRAGYKYCYEDANKAESSYRSHEGLLGFSFPLVWNVRGDVSVTYNETVYPDFQEDERKDKRTIYAISLTRPLSKGLQIMISYSRTYNDSNVQIDGKDPYGYRKNVYSLTASYRF